MIHHIVRYGKMKDLDMTTIYLSLLQLFMMASEQQLTTIRCMGATQLLYLAEKEFELVIDEEVTVMAL